MHAHLKNCLHRRQFGFLAAGAAGFALVPLSARAGHAEALVLTCMDYRLVDDEVKFFDAKHFSGEYDQVSLAGASLAGVSDRFPSSNAAVWDHVNIAKSLHHIREVIVVDHRDCGAYKVAFGDKFAAEPAAETAQHKDVMAAFKVALAARHPDLGVEFYLMALDGTAEAIEI